MTDTTGEVPSSELARSSPRRSLAVLMYHDLGVPPENPMFHDCVLEPSLFDEQLSALRDAGFVAEPASRLATAELTDAAANPLIITFDDAYISFVDVAQPLLAKYKMTATLFAPTAFIGGRAAWMDEIGEGNRRLLGWQDLRDLDAGGIEIGGHGHEHLGLDLLDRNRLIADIDRNRTLLEDCLGHSVRTFAYPYGHHSRQVRNEVRRSGYEIAFETGDDLYTPSPGRHYSIKRILVAPDMDPGRLIHTIRHGQSSPLARKVRLRLGPAYWFIKRQRRRQWPRPGEG
jgi:peptidoglycan/xylan/chitin deacetylase (PgdA/CDA1 family)